MIFPGAGGPELDKMASEKVKKDIGTFITFGLLVEAAAFAAHYFGIDGILI
ncbi:Protein CBG15189 [Caenorhabditis briggsae]|uniref:Protein CBG15189 n=1 Tax=Caenorhabditis briggsae TaxID=6238 RepID=A8XLQ6_CAEBR|nr:Protein CBG15189 [Caenorhabditis briggsae]CAP33560.1 Protein CBG15189 [Caenorhabditis briggsae]